MTCTLLIHVAVFGTLGRPRVHTYRFRNIVVFVTACIEDLAAAIQAATLYQN